MGDKIPVNICVIVILKHTFVSSRPMDGNIKEQKDRDIKLIKHIELYLFLHCNFCLLFITAGHNGRFRFDMVYVFSFSLLLSIIFKETSKHIHIDFSSLLKSFYMLNKDTNNIYSFSFYLFLTLF